MSSSELLPAIDLSRILLAQEKPQPFEPGRAPVLDRPTYRQPDAILPPGPDPGRGQPATRNHRPHHEMDCVTSVGLQPGDHILDLGCGPGLYAQRLAQAGFQVTGVDFSQNSIDYAHSQAREKQLPIQYRCQSYLELDEPALYSAVLLIYGDFCPLSPEQRAKLLANVRRALKPNGCFILDVTTPHLRQKDGLKNGWYAAGQGFWKPGPHLVLEQGFAYPNDLFLDQYIVIEDDGKISVYRNWFQDYTPETIRTELSAAGFEVESLWNDLAGTSYTPDSDWIGIVARTKASGSS
jgi:SAM-dependent methyltransferase